jgi:hypothetical protein
MSQFLASRSRTLTLTFGITALAGLGVLSTPASAEQRGVPRAERRESPGGTCYKFKYPDVAECGKLKGKEECKANPTIDSEKDEKKKEACKPEKGDECSCGDDDISF